ncbi:hypothetical protein LJC59_08955 [Desulfovibrio sp. OttesenSCG-928-A18]|nr:hypothetical protein [Desulfovibrio sp. OttesenSCG-928-A18]
MSVLGNILWYFPFLGFLTALFTFLVGSLLTVLVVTAPIGLGLIQLSKFLLAPFSYSMCTSAELQREQNKAWKAYSTIIMLLYLPIGCILAVMTIFQIVLLAISIIGIPAAIALSKAVGTYLNPVGKICVSRQVAEAIDREKGEAELQKYQQA